MLHRHCLTRFLASNWLLLTLLLHGLPVHAQQSATAAAPFSGEWLQQHARALARAPYEPPALAADSALELLDYDAFRRIVFDPAAAIWRDTPASFQLQLFHPGALHRNAVEINLVSSGLARRLDFDASMFRFAEELNLDKLPTAQGFTGFRVHYPINSAERFEEFLVFLGASYFRAVGEQQFYGISARGLAINTTGPGAEEFPYFTRFWIERPTAGSDQLLVHALLDSPSVAGAYQFVIRPGETTRMDVEATLYAREDINRFGIAPLTSMFFFDATNRGGFDDYRPAVHDSDGLKILQANGERVWRPLINPDGFQVSYFGGASPQGFGLLQRRQAFAQFRDDEARYDKRPSLWIEPLDEWGEGHVELVEIPTADEVQDNIVAYWQPAMTLKAGQVYQYRYRMHWGRELTGAPVSGWVRETAAGSVPDSTDRLFVIDYHNGAMIPGVATNPDAVQIHATTSAGRISGVSGTLVAATGDYRAYVKLDPAGAEMAELRVTLSVDGQQWGETWLYRWHQ